MADHDFSTKRLLSLRRLTRSVADLMKGQIKDYLALLAPQFQLKPFFGEFIEGPKDFVKGAETNFKELKAAYEAIAKAKPFSLPSDFKTPIVVASQVPEIYPIEYLHEPKVEGQSKKVTVTAPLRFALTYSGFSPSRLRGLLAGQGFASDVQELVLHTLMINLVIAKQPGLGRLFAALRLPISIGKIPGCGELPFVIMTGAAPTLLPPDDVIVESTEISGNDAFEEVVNMAELSALGDPLKEKLLELAKQHGEGGTGG
jgi:hypothetical protein